MKTCYLIFIFLLFVSILGCEKISNDDNGTIYGSWKVSEEGAKYSIRTYMVDIVKSSFDTTVVVINNFYMLGYDDEISCRLTDSTLTILPFGSGSFITGTGIYSKTARTIRWNYIVNSTADVDVVHATYTKN